MELEEGREEVREPRRDVQVDGRLGREGRKGEGAGRDGDDHVVAPDARERGDGLVLLAGLDVDEAPAHDAVGAGRRGRAQVDVAQALGPSAEAGGDERLLEGATRRLARVGEGRVREEEELEEVGGRDERGVRGKGEDGEEARELDERRLREERDLGARVGLDAGSHLGACRRKARHQHSSTSKRSTRPSGGLGADAAG